MYYTIDIFCMLFVSPQHILFIFIATIVAAIGIYILKKNRKDTVHRLFSLFTLSVSTWIIGFVLLHITENFFFNRIILLGGIFVTFSLFLLSLTFPNKKLKRSVLFRSAAPLIVNILFIIPPQLIISETIIHPNGQLEPVNGPLFPLYAATLAGYIFLSIYYFIKHFRLSRGHTRLQMKYFFTGLIIFITAALIFDAILPAFGITQLNTLGPISSLIFVGFTAYAIVRHQLLDIRVVIQRGIVYTVLFALIVGLYLSLIGILGYVVHITANLAAIIAAGITTIIGIFSTPKIDQYLRKVTDKFLFKDKYDYSDALYRLSKILNTNVDLDMIIRESSEELQKILRVSSVDILSKEELGEVNYELADEYKLMIPVRYENKIRGHIIVDKKLSGDPFTKEDKALLHTFSEQAGIALKKAQLFGEVESYSLELEDKVKERTAEIEKLQRDQEQMMIDISHQLQDPLTMAKMEIGAIKETSPKNKAIDVFERSVDDISGFTYRLIHLAKLNQASFEFEKEKINLSNLLEEIIEYFEILTEEKDILVNHYIEPEIKLTGNRKSLEELITNLFSNAIKYNIRKTKNKKIYIGLTEKENTIQLQVEDTGIGIEPEELPFIFNRFHRTKKRPKDSIKSTGLGLSIARRIAELHGGKIEVLSVLNKGSTFTVSFPKDG